MNITLDKQIALEILLNNKKEHIEIYKKALEGWKVEMEKHSLLLSEWATNSGKNEERPKEPSKPVSYEKTYDELIQKLEYHALDLIEVPDYEFDQIINNNFGWMSNFLSTSSMYTSK
jgi:hypothetical protein